jgi:osmotically-inducible protein OsmY
MTEPGAAECAQLVTRIRDALARHEGELGIDVIVEAGSVTLRGVVQTDGRRSRLEALSRRVSEGLVVVNEIQICPPDPPAIAETVP